MILQDGFEATANAEFTARIINCTGASVLADNTSEESSNADQLADNKLILAVYPTITEGTVNISMDNTIEKQVEIVVTDNSGRIVTRLINAGKKIVTLNLGHLTNGLYFVQVKQGEKMITRKVIIRH